MIHATCRLTAKNRDQLQNHTLSNRIWAIYLPFLLQDWLMQINQHHREMYSLACMHVKVKKKLVYEIIQRSKLSTNSSRLNWNKLGRQSYNNYQAQLWMTLDHSTPWAKIMTRPGSIIIASAMCTFSHAITTTACLPTHRWRLFITSIGESPFLPGLP